MTLSVDDLEQQATECVSDSTISLDPAEVLALVATVRALQAERDDLILERHEWIACMLRMNVECYEAQKRADAGENR